MSVSLYLIVKACHIISFTAWMAGMFYLPRLYVYHAEATPGGEFSETLKVMERRLLRIIINPAMILTFGFGLWLAGIGGIWGEGWFHAKLGLVMILAGFHGACAIWRKRFLRDANTHSARFYRMMNEVPTLLLVGIVLLAVLKPL